MNEPIRILQVFAQMNRGGAETMIMELYRNIDRSKIQFDFIVHTEKKCEFDCEIRKLGGRIFNVPRYNGKNHFRYKKIWKGFFETHTEYKVVHGHVRSTAAIYLAIAKKFGKITISHSHSTTSGLGISAVIKNIMQLPIKLTADYLFACSKSAGDWLFGKEETRKKDLFILNNGIDLNRFKYDGLKRMKIRQELEISERFVVGHVGRFHSLKNHIFIINVFKHIHKINQNSVLVLVGDGELREVIKDKVEQENLSDSVIFTGVKNNVQDFFQAMDVFLFPSLHEGLGIVTIEAQASGLPTFVSEAIPKEAYITDLIEMISLKSSAKDWAIKILKCNKVYKRTNTYEQLKASGYDIRETTKILEEFYLRILEE